MTTSSSGTYWAGLALFSGAVIYGGYLAINHLSSLQKTIDEQRSHITTLQGTVDSQKSKMTSFEKEAKANYFALSIKSGATTIELSKATKDLDSQQKTISELSEKVISLETRNSELSDQVSSLLSKNSTLELQLELGLSEYQSKIEKLEAELEQDKSPLTYSSPVHTSHHPSSMSSRHSLSTFAPTLLTQPPLRQATAYNGGINTGPLKSATRFNMFSSTINSVLNNRENK